MGRSIIDRQDFIQRLCHAAIHYLVWVDEPVPYPSLVGIRLLARCVYVCWTDCYEVDTETREYADWVVGCVRSYRTGEISLERAITYIQTAERLVVERRGC